MENQSEKKWYQKPTAVVLLLIFFFPVGLYLMWKHEVWSKTSRWVVSGVFALAVIANANNNGSSNSNNNSVCNHISGTYTGTSKMGYTSGSAKITINSNCSATLSYDQGNMGSATEYGEITQAGINYKFKSSDGGTYDLSISNNRVVLDGYNWQCIMTK
tara:strand:+ start:180 stop:656 length:477 start_codon:yes stop_codon:yes gene_type:complete